MNRRAVFLVLLAVAGMSGCPPRAWSQTPCPADSQTINCHVDPKYGMIVNGSAPLEPLGNPASTTPAPDPQAAERQQRKDEEDLRQAREVERREDAAKVAGGAAFALQFQPVFDQVKVNEYPGLLDRFYGMTKPTVKINVIGGASSPDNMGESYRKDPDFWGALFVRMGVANLESAEVSGDMIAASTGFGYLLRARDLGIPDAYDVFDQLSTLGLSWLVPKDWSSTFSADVKKWRELGASDKQPGLKLAPSIQLAERRKLLDPYLQAKRQRDAIDEQKVTAAKQAAAVALARTPLTPEATRLIQQQGVLITKALALSSKKASGFREPFDASAPLAKGKASAIVTEARAALVPMEQQYGERMGNRQSGPEANLLDGLRRVIASTACTPQAPTGCASLVQTLDITDYRLEKPPGYWDAISMFALVACHDERDPRSCSLLASNARGSSNEKVAAKALGYYAMACSAEKVPTAKYKSGCNDAGSCLLEGKCGPRDINLGAEFYELACAHESARDCSINREQVEKARKHASR